MIIITEAVALLGGTSFELSQLQCEDIKLHLHKDYFDLCSANVPVTEQLFGYTLPTQLAHIRVRQRAPLIIQGIPITGKASVLVGLP